ncbi:S1C family serine protease [Chondromyces apiculatus]|uniref:HtrA family serine protease n=1 Tax=Chondromyces apiculatus DSM 436 TaxID=1192034 RepID=A0A017TCB8_9BACT|nr:S1C family serine protease [Chondromyces apiculatus]EYF06266.1 HtrA family serine protease [Chondromyces apiculatus DSM 436]
MIEITPSSLAPIATPGPVVDRPAVKHRQRRLLACLTLGLCGLLVTPRAMAQDDPDQEASQDEAEEERAPAPPPRPTSKKKKAPPPLPPPPAADAQEPGEEAAEDTREATAKAGKDAKPKAPKAPTLEERALRGVVVIARGDQVLGMGSVLAGDGRILTALSTLGPGNHLEVRYADGTQARVKLGHHDRVWDLALLIPQSGKWKEGLTASARDPVRKDAEIRSFTAVRGKPAAAPLVLRGKRNLLGGDDQELDDVLDLGSRVSPADLGAPILDEEGRVVGVLGRGCAPSDGDKPCSPVAFGAPIHAIRNFLRTVPPTAVQPSGWLGIQGVGETGTLARGVRVTGVHPGGPADEAKLRGGDKGMADMILAVNGTPVTTPEALSEAIRIHAVGEKLPLIVFGSDGRYRQVTVTLRAAPDAKAAAAQNPAPPADPPPASAPRRKAPAARPR